MKAKQVIGTILLVQALAFISGEAFAQSSGNEAAQRLQGQLMEVETARRALQIEVTRLQAELAKRDAAPAKSAAAPKDAGVPARAARQGREIASLKTTLQERDAAIAQLKADLAAQKTGQAETDAKLRQQATAAANMAAVADNARQTLALRDELLELCRARNAELYTLGKEALDRYVSMDSAEFFARREPFAQLKRVQMENAAQDFEDRLRAARVHKETLPPSLEKKMQSDLAKPRP